MATVTGVTKQYADDIEDQIIVSASRSGTSLILNSKGGGSINIPNAFPALYESYAIGQILMTDRAANPSTYLGGGTWVRWGKGRVPVSLDEAQAEFDGLEELGGSKTHTLSNAEMPGHSHGGNTGYQSHDHGHGGYTSADGNHQHGYLQPAAENSYVMGQNGRFVQRTGGATDWAGHHSHSIQTYGVDTNHYHGISSDGGGQPHNNLQPYITCYMWKRTA